MKVYVAGAYTGENIRNIRAAIDTAEKLVDLGHTPFVPHLSGVWDLIHPRPYEFWLAYDVEWLLACDALYRLPGPSGGADREEDVARACGIPIYRSLAELPPSTGQLVGLNLNHGVSPATVNPAMTTPRVRIDVTPQQGGLLAPDDPSGRDIGAGR